MGKRKIGLIIVLGLVAAAGPLTVLALMLRRANASLHALAGWSAVVTTTLADEIAAKGTLQPLGAKSGKTSYKAYLVKNVDVLAFMQKGLGDGLVVHMGQSLNWLDQPTQGRGSLFHRGNFPMSHSWSEISQWGSRDNQSQYTSMGGGTYMLINLRGGAQLETRFNGYVDLDDFTNRGPSTQLNARTLFEFTGEVPDGMALAFLADLGKFKDQPVSSLLVWQMSSAPPDRNTKQQAWLEKQFTGQPTTTGQPGSRPASGRIAP